MRTMEKPQSIWEWLRHPWVALYIIIYAGGLAALAALGNPEALRDVLRALLQASVGLTLTLWATREEGSRPGPAPQAWPGVFLALALTACQILRPRFLCPEFGSEPVRELLVQVGWLLLLPAAILLLGRVPWNYLGLTSLVRGGGRWRKLGLLLTAALFFPALLDPQVTTALMEGPLSRLLLALPIAYGYAWLARALPQEFLYRQVLQPRLQALLQRTIGAIVAQAILFGLAGAGWRIAVGIPWPTALLSALLEGSALGLLYGLLRDRSGSLLLPIHLHAWIEMWLVLPQALLWLAS
jgi:membrane protease YdiL (CAAX protease family)